MQYEHRRDRWCTCQRRMATRIAADAARNSVVKMDRENANIFGAANRRMLMEERENDMGEKAAGRSRLHTKAP